MKQKPLMRYGGLMLLLALSLFSFLYVNLDAAHKTKGVGHAYNTEKVMPREDERSESYIPTFGEALVARVLNALYRLVSNLPERY